MNETGLAGEERRCFSRTQQLISMHCLFMFTCFHRSNLNFNLSLCKSASTSWVSSLFSFNKSSENNEVNDDGNIKTRNVMKSFLCIKQCRRVLHEVRQRIDFWTLPSLKNSFCSIFVTFHIVVLDRGLRIKDEKLLQWFHSWRMSWIGLRSRRILRFYGLSESQKFIKMLIRKVNPEEPLSSR